jgi:hypothetical protein
MQVSSQEYRQAALMAATVAVVPLLFFPNDLGLKINMSPFLFFLIELVFYWAVFSFTLRGTPVKNVFTAGTVCFFTRLAVGTVFAFLLMGMYGTPMKDAFAAGLYQYKPAMMLQVISFPFIMMTIIRKYFNSTSAKKTKLVIQSGNPEVEEQPKPIAKIDEFNDRKIIGLKATVAEQQYAGFDEALKYVGELAAVRFAVLIDSQGLPVSFFGENTSLRNLWSAIGVYLVDKINEPLSRAGNYNLEGFELTLDLYRLHVVKVNDLFLLVAADRSSSETEKVRVTQAATMIKKIYDERYNLKPDTKAREDSYVPSFS